MSWIDSARDRPVVDVAAELGYEVRRHSSSSSTVCPACGAERRHTKSRDRRGAVGMPHGTPQAWRCFQCDAAGDAIDFVACHVGNARYRDLGDDARGEVRKHFGGDTAPTYTPGPRTQPLPVEHQNAFRNYPPTSEVDALWERCKQLDYDREAVAYLSWRGIDWAPLVDVARVLPVACECPQWAVFGDRPWARTGHRLIVPLYDSLGRMRSFVARSVERAPLRKSLGAKDHERGGLVMAGVYAREVLRTGAHPSWHRMQNLRVTIHEGEVDHLRAVSLGADDEVLSGDGVDSYRAAFGIFAGSWQRDIAARVPSKSLVVLATDDDKDGDKYAEEIRERTGDRCEYERVRVAQDRPAT